MEISSEEAYDDSLRFLHEFATILFAYGGATMLVSMAWWSLGILVTAAVLFAVFHRRILKIFRDREARTALAQFRYQREYLEARFFDLASRRGKPRNLRWKDCQWQSEVTFARDAESGLLTAFVAVNISFEAVEGEDMEDVEAVGLLRDAAAIFHFQDGVWGTGGRALFNMNPADALERLQGQYLPLGIEVPVPTYPASTRSVANRTPMT
jgi:hypothetical protein